MWKSLLIFGVILTIIDLIWLRGVMMHLYTSWFKQINLSISGNILAAIVAYALMVLAYPLLVRGGSPQDELIKAAAFGAIAYGIYGFTVAAVFPKYSISFATLETVWGMTLYTTSVFLTQKVLAHM